MGQLSGLFGGKQTITTLLGFMEDKEDAELDVWEVDDMKLKVEVRELDDSAAKVEDAEVTEVHEREEFR